MTPNNKIELVEIFSSSPVAAEIVRTLLKNSDIESFLKDENMGTIAPWQVSPGGVGSVKVMISNPDFDRASVLVDEYNNRSDSK